MKKIATLFFALLCLTAHAQDIVGFWKAIDEDTGMARCVVAVYPYEGLCYGRIIGTFNDAGQIKDSIYKPIERAPGVVGDPYYCGLDIIWELEQDGDSFYGKILDPEKGSVYRAVLWREGDDLIVRGKLLFFFRSQTWLPASASDFPKDFKLPDLNKIVPKVPEVK